jgi:hypothetical protein
VSLHVKVGGKWVEIAPSGSGGGVPTPVYGEANEALSTNVTFTTITQGGKRYRVASFLTTGSLVMTTPAKIDYLMIGGGGGSGANYRNEGYQGGGAGYPQVGSADLPAGTYPVVVGTAGRGSDSYPDGGNNRTPAAEGTPSTFNGLTADGGGRGGGYEYDKTKNAGLGAGGSGIEPIRSTITGTEVEYGWGPQGTTNAAKGSAGGNGSPQAGQPGIVVVRWEIAPPAAGAGMAWAEITASGAGVASGETADSEGVWSWFHFTGDADLTVTAPGLVEVFAVGGGGGMWANWMGTENWPRGGGGGGRVKDGMYQFPSGVHAVKIGAGGSREGVGGSTSIGQVVKTGSSGMQGGALTDPGQTEIINDWTGTPLGFCQNMLFAARPNRGDGGGASGDAVGGGSSGAVIVRVRKP